MERWHVLVAPILVATALLGLSNPASALQAGGLHLELGAGRILPPSGTSAESADYVTAALQIDHWWSEDRAVFASVSGGLDAGGRGGDWGSAAAGFTTHLLGGASGPSLGVDAVAYGFHVDGPYGYQAWTVEASPVLEVPAGPLVLGLRGEAGMGRSTAEFRLTDGTRIVETDLEAWGGGPEVRFPVGLASVAFDAAWIRSRERTFRRIGARITGGEALRWRARIERWDAPRRAVTTGEVSLEVAMGGAGKWIAGIRGGRTEPDPLTLTRPGEHGGITLARSLVTFDGAESSSMVEVMRSDSEGAIVRIRLAAPDASRVELLGDFTDWEAVPMQRNGEGWILETEVPPGTYHFGFLADGEWFLPDDAPGLISDDWGRSNATLVVY